MKGDLDSFPFFMVDDQDVKWDITFAQYDVDLLMNRAGFNSSSSGIFGKKYSLALQTPINYYLFPDNHFIMAILLFKHIKDTKTYKPGKACGSFL